MAMSIKKCCANCTKYQQSECEYRSDILYSACNDMEFHIVCDEYEVDKRRVDDIKSALDEIIPAPAPYPIQPIIAPYYQAPCSDWAHCSNPHHDCVNCPLMYGGGDLGTWGTTTELKTRHDGTGDAETTK